MTDQLRIVITGAAGGAGSAAVELFAEDGASVAAVVHKTGLSATLRGFPNVHEFACDISDRGAVHAIFDRIARDLGGVDALIHTAAVEGYVRASDIDDTHLTPILRVNIGGTIYTNQAAHRHMRDAGGGSIVNFHSLAAILGAFSDLGHYAASKGAVGAWTRTAAREWGPDGVRVNAIAPVMRTTMLDNYLGTLSEDELTAYTESMRGVIHLNDGKHGDPKQHIAPVLRFLASDASAFITGQTIAVDGGWAKLGS